jgi:hypothetical protein
MSMQGGRRRSHRRALNSSPLSAAAICSCFHTIARAKGNRARCASACHDPGILLLAGKIDVMLFSRDRRLVGPKGEGISADATRLKPLNLNG